MQSFIRWQTNHVLVRRQLLHQLNLRGATAALLAVLYCRTDDAWTSQQRPSLPTERAKATVSVAETHELLILDAARTIQAVSVVDTVRYRAQAAAPTEPISPTNQKKQNQTTLPRMSQNNSICCKDSCGIIVWFCFLLFVILNCAAPIL